MKIVAVSDMHGRLGPVTTIVERERPDVLLSPGDWGDASEVDAADFQPFLERQPVLTTFGNHDNLELLPTLDNRDGSPILLENGTAREIAGLRIAGINGIWAKSHRKPFYITDEEVLAIARKLADQRIDILITHGCPIGMADLTPINTHGGKRCFTEAFARIQPALHLCGHLHRASSHRTRDGKLVVNVGFTHDGDYAVFDWETGLTQWEARRLRVSEA
jgi:Icc-related predicted phosphoesterase